jgi:hypothetical protein
MLIPDEEEGSMGGKERKKNNNEKGIPHAVEVCGMWWKKSAETPPTQRIQKPGARVVKHTPVLAHTVFLLFLSHASSSCLLRGPTAPPSLCEIRISPGHEHVLQEPTNPEVHEYEDQLAERWHVQVDVWQQKVSSALRNEAVHEAGQDRCNAARGVK